MPIKLYSFFPVRKFLYQKLLPGILKTVLKVKSKILTCLAFLACFIINSNKYYIKITLDNTNSVILFFNQPHNLSLFEGLYYFVKLF